jgi:predicted O-methyltransferase YrrM
VAVDFTLPTWHSVFNGTDEMASHPASVDLVAMLVHFIQPETVVEAGTYKGHLTLAIAQILHTNNRGIIWSADLHDGDVGKWLASDANYLTSRVRLYLGDYLDMLKEVPGDIDLAYIDASDPNDSRLRLTHAERTFDRLRPGGLLLADDTESKDWKEAQMFRDWAKCSGIHLTQHRGLTLIQKPQNDS